jgi:hypothetical protein
MSFSPYKKPFEERIAKWDQTLCTSQDVIEEWLKVQQSWLYLEPIFSSDDIAAQLPTENKRCVIGRLGPAQHVTQIDVTLSKHRCHAQQNRCHAQQASVSRAAKSMSRDANR